MSALPIEAVLPDLKAALRAGSNAVLVAPPGAGKTTMAAPALLGEEWCGGEIWLLSPRRLAVMMSSSATSREYAYISSTGNCPSDSMLWPCMSPQ